MVLMYSRSITVLPTLNITSNNYHKKEGTLPLHKTQTGHIYMSAYFFYFDTSIVTVFNSCTS